MKRIKVTTGFPDEPILRQTPGQSGRWDEFEFIVNQPVTECDAWVVLDGLVEEDSTSSPPGCTVLATAEPPDIRSYRPAFLDQFDCVVTAQRGLRHRHVIRRQLPLPWWIGMAIHGEPPNARRQCVLDYDGLRSLQRAGKPELISVICSNDRLTPGHDERLRFLDQLRQHFGDRLHVFGFGFRQIPDKLEAIYPYRYHLVFENSRIEHYWTEKLADAYLGFAYPIYSGCPNIEDFFPATSFTAINPARPDEALATIERVIREDLATRSQEAVAEARERILARHNLFAALAEICRKLPAAPARAVTLRPEDLYPDPLAWRLRRRLARLLGPRSPLGAAS